MRRQAASGASRRRTMPDGSTNSPLSSRTTSTWSSLVTTNIQTRIPACASSSPDAPKISHHAPLRRLAGIDSAGSTVPIVRCGRACDGVPVIVVSSSGTRSRPPGSAVTCLGDERPSTVAYVSVNRGTCWIPPQPTASTKTSRDCRPACHSRFWSAAGHNSISPGVAFNRVQPPAACCPGGRCPPPRTVYFPRIGRLLAMARVASSACSRAVRVPCWHARSSPGQPIPGKAAQPNLGNWRAVHQGSAEYCRHPPRRAMRRVGRPCPAGAAWWPAPGGRGGRRPVAAVAGARCPRWPAPGARAVTVRISRTQRLLLPSSEDKLRALVNILHVSVAKLTVISTKRPSVPSPAALATRHGTAHLRSRRNAT